MIAIVECSICKERLYFDTKDPINPERYGWKEIHDLRANNEEMIRFLNPICPDCIKKIPIYKFKEE